ncbi:MAG: T9SS type A sorting domain-containing protein [Bacteroidota bacterium]
MQRLFLLFTSLVFFTVLSQLQAQCWPEGFTHDTRPEAMWLSCTPSANPNPVRGTGLWLHFDLGAEYGLGTSTIWNYNEPGMEELGVTRLAVDYSLDGHSWTSWGEVDLPPATGRRNYAGVIGPDLKGVRARFLVLTALTSAGEIPNCAGLAEVRFNLDETVSVREADIPNELEVFPNPTAGELQIRLPGKQIKSVGIYDQAGRLLQQTGYFGEAGTLDLEGLPAGAYYLLRATDQAGMIYRRRIVKL